MIAGKFDRKSTPHGGRFQSAWNLIKLGRQISVQSIESNGPRLQNQPVQFLYWRVNQFVPPEDWKHGSRPGNTLVVQFDWRSRTKFVRAAF